MALLLGQAGMRAQAPGTSLRDTRGFEMASASVCLFPGPPELPFPSTVQEAVVKMQVGPSSWVEIVK